MTVHTNTNASADSLLQAVPGKRDGGQPVRDDLAQKAQPKNNLSTAAASQLGELLATQPQTIPSFSPLYQQIKALILQSLKAGEWRPAEPIPSETELAARYQVSQGTVRKAIDELAMENLLIRKQGVGTFVATHHEERVQYRFLKLVPDGQNPLNPPSAPPSRHILWCKRAKASALVAQNLNLKQGDGVVHIRRILSFDEKATILEDLFLPLNPFKGLNAEELRLYPGPTYALFETTYGVRMVKAREKIRAVSASAKDAQLLQVPVGSALLSVQRVAYTYQDIPMELRNAVYRTDHHHYQNELN
jgi:GntR family transcriptional regulator